MEIFNYLRFICADDSYLKVVFNATDSMVMAALQLYKKALDGKNMCQLAQLHNNVCYFQKSLTYYEKTIATISKSNVSSYQFSSLALFTQSKYALSRTNHTA